MTDMNAFHYTDGVHDVLAVYVNRIMDATLRSEYKNIEVLAGNKTLTDADTPIQVYDCDNANRDVLMPEPNAINNHPFWIVNGSSGAEVITIKSNDGATVLGTLAVGAGKMMLPNGSGGYIAVGSGDGGGGADVLQVQVFS